MRILFAILAVSMCIPMGALYGAHPGQMQANAESYSAPNRDDVESSLTRVRTYLEHHDDVAAEALLRELLSSHPTLLPADGLLGDLLLRHQRFEEALQEFEAVLKSDERTSELTESATRGERESAVGLALKLRKLGDGVAALQSLEHALVYLPDDPSLLTDAGIEADALGKFEMAQKALETVLKQNPEDPRALYALARTEVDRDDPRRAETLFHAYLALRPSDASAHYGLGHLLQMEQRTDDAAVEFRRSIDLQPAQTESYYQLGEIALDARSDAEARSLFERTLARLPTHGGAQTGIGIIDYRAKLFTSARASLERAIADSPEYEPAHYYLGLTLGRLGEKEASSRELAIARELASKQQNQGKPIESTFP